VLRAGCLLRLIVLSFVLLDDLVFGLAECKDTAVWFYADPCRIIWVAKTSCDAFGVESDFAVTQLADDVCVESDGDHTPHIPSHSWSNKLNTPFSSSVLISASDNGIRDLCKNGLPR